MKKNKNKRFSTYFILAMICFGVAIITSILGLVFYKYALILVIVTLVLILGGIGLIIADIYVRKDKKLVIKMDQENILNSIKSYQNNQQILTKINSNDEGLM